MILETERLYLREMVPEDFDALKRVLGDSDIMKHYPYTFDDKRIHNWIFRNQERYRIFGFGLWAVCLKENDEMIGDCGLSMQLIHGVIKPEIGYHLRRDMQGRGYAKEAASAVRDWTFRNTPFQEIYSYMTASNEPSERCAISWGCRKVDEYFDETDRENIKVYMIDKMNWCKNKYKIVKLAERRDLKEKASEWYSSKWSVPKEAYLESIEESFNTRVPSWYLCMDGDKIIGGMGVIENDFHNRKDLTPNVCAVYTEPEYRKQGIASMLLDYICEDMASIGINTLYLLTDLTGFYERCGWEFYCMVQGDGEEEMSRMYIHRV